MVSRHCAACCRHLDRTSFSRTQWCKPIGTSRCYACVENRQGVGSGIGNGSTTNTQGSNRASQTARRNNATSATFTNYNLDNPFAEGGFRWVAKGKYIEGARSGEACVCKWFKTGQVFESTFFDLDIKAMNKALDIVTEWNSHQFINQIVKVNIPEVWTFNNSSGKRSGTKVLQEPFIINYTKFNSNSGWADDATPWPRVMQALSHFSYHVSGGQFVLCDLQGGLYSNGVVLTDPVILSRNKRFGVTDLGSKGISSFFSNHVCNEFCKNDWAMPADRTRYFNPQQGTSMIGTGANHHVPARRSRAPLTGIYE
jgi:hypothetical protein